jgi:hypothetical protein
VCIVYEDGRAGLSVDLPLELLRHEKAEFSCACVRWKYNTRHVQVFFVNMKVCRAFSGVFLSKNLCHLDTPNPKDSASRCFSCPPSRLKPELYSPSSHNRTVYSQA